jgi:hypothetical protein
VVDRRRFNDEGELRAEKTEPQTTESAPESPARTDEPSGESAGAPKSDSIPPPMSNETAPPLFIELVAMLAHQAELLLTGAEDFPAQPAEAKRFIDYLGVLEEKTRGNLSSDEAQALSTILFQLRAVFVQSHR